MRTAQVGELQVGLGCCIPDWLSRQKVGELEDVGAVLENGSLVYDRLGERGLDGVAGVEHAKAPFRIVEAVAPELGPERLAGRRPAHSNQRRDLYIDRHQ